MKLCKSCRSIWPGDPQFCGGCGGSYDARYCEHGHKSPINASHCLVCGSRHLSNPVQSLSLSSAAKLIAWITVLLLVKWTFPHLGGVLGFLLKGIDWLSGFVFGVRLSVLLASAFYLCLNMVVLTAVLALVCPGFRKHVPTIFRGLAKILRLLWKLSTALIRLAFRVLKWVAQGASIDPKRR